MDKKEFAKVLTAAIVLITFTGVAGGYTALQSSIPLTVEEPLEILKYNGSLNVFPGETLNFQVEVENHASISYNASLLFCLNDTEYQQKFVTFSDYVYAVNPGRCILDSWLWVSNAAPAANLEMAITIIRSPEPYSNSTEPASGSAPSATLFSAGAKWAAGNGTSVLYINWFDNYLAHHLTDGAEWGPWWREGGLETIKNSTVTMLEQQGLKVTCAPDVPTNISGYDLVVFEAWFAVEPKHSQLVRDYLEGGGNVVIMAGTPCYFSTYCKDLWPYRTGGMNLSSLEDWFGSACFANSGGTANLVVDRPFGTVLENQSQVYHIDAYGCYALISMSDDSTAIARWSDGTVFAFVHEYGAGRIYYQAELVW